MDTILVDDEIISLKNLEFILSHFPEFRIVGSYTDPLEALAFAERRPIDVAFLDIEMHELNGTQLAKELLRLHPDLMVVFTTAYDEYAIRAFEIDARDYLLKPLTVGKLQNTAEKIKRQYQLLQSGARSKDAEADNPVLSRNSDRLVGKKEGRICVLNTKDVDYVYSVGRHVYAAIGQTCYEMQGSLSDWELHLSKRGFARCHKSFLVNLEKIEYIAPLFKNNYTIKLFHSNEDIPLSRKYVKTLKDWLHI